MSEQLADLLARVKAATRPDREIDMRVLCAIACPQNRVERSRFNGEWCIFDRGERSWENRDWWRHDGWRLTESLDACVAIAERALPGCWWQVFKQASKEHKIEYAANIIGALSDPGFGPTPALALLGATLSTLLAKDQSS